MCQVEVCRALIGGYGTSNDPLVRGDGRHMTTWYEWVMHPMNVRGVAVGQLRDGKITVNRDYWNGAKYAIPMSEKSGPLSTE